MKFALEISCVLAIASGAIGGPCFKHAEGAHKQDCVDKNELRLYGPDYCSSNWNMMMGDWIHFADSGGHMANVGKVQKFVSKQACEQAFAQIVDNCYDGWDGGSWAAYGVLLTINFCKWELTWEPL